MLSIPKLSSEDICELVNEAIEVEGGIRGKITPAVVTYDSYTLRYQSEFDKTVLNIHDFSILHDDMQNEEVSLVFDGNNLTSPSFAY